MSTPEYDQWLQETLGDATDKLFRHHLAGASYRNDDGTSRQVLIAACEPREVLTLMPEPLNEYDPNAIAVLNEAGQQLGYLEKRLAGEMTRSMAHGRHWGALVQEIARSDGHSTVGLIMVIFRTKPGISFTVVPELPAVVAAPAPAVDVQKPKGFWARLFGA